MEPKYKVGDLVWWAHFGTAETSVTCPDCGGTGRLRVTFHDETQVSIDCKNCSPGYEPPTGRVPCWNRKGEAKRTRITGMEISGEKVTYRSGSDSCWYNLTEDQIFSNEADALTRANALAAEADAEERSRIFQKEKDTRTWAWNASYHRREIKEAQRRLDYHTAKLNVAKIKAKEPVAPDFGNFDTPEDNQREREKGE